MKLTSPRSPILLVAVIVGLIGATALVAGYVERPGQTAKVAANEDTCGGCPLAGTEACCQAKCEGECRDGCCGVCTQPACCASAATAGCQMKAKVGCGPTGCSQTL